MKRPLRYRTMGAVREGRGNPSPYSIGFLNVLVVLLRFVVLRGGNNHVVWKNSKYIYKYLGSNTY